ISYGRPGSCRHRGTPPPVVRPPRSRPPGRWWRAGTRTGSPGRRLPDGRHDIRIGRASAQVAAHPLPYLGAVELRGVGEIRGDITGIPGLRLGQHPHRRTHLPGRAVTALEAVVLQKRLLDRV